MDKSAVSAGSMIKKIHELRHDLKTQEIIAIIRAATTNGVIDEAKAVQLAKDL